MRDTFVRTLIELAAADRNIHLVTGDLGFGVLRPFWEQLPGQFSNLGIAEQNMTAFAAGMALEGKTVFTYSIGNFPTLRALEQIRNDCAYHEANVKIVCVGGGFVYGALGMSHHATEDIAVMRALPGVAVLAPGDPVEAACATRAICRHPGTCYLRLGRGGEKQIHEAPPDFAIGRALTVAAGGRLALLSTGAICDQASEARDRLAARGVAAGLYTFPTVKPLDTALLFKLAVTCDMIVTVEEHNVTGGFGGAVAEVLASLPAPRACLLRIGIEDCYAQAVGSQACLRDHYGLSARKIAARVLAQLT